MSIFQNDATGVPMPGFVYINTRDRYCSVLTFKKRNQKGMPPRMPPKRGELHKLQFSNPGEQNLPRNGNRRAIIISSDEDDALVDSSDEDDALVDSSDEDDAPISSTGSGVTPMVSDEDDATSALVSAANVAGPISSTGSGVTPMVSASTLVLADDEEILPPGDPGELLSDEESTTEQEHVSRNLWI
jgi:hypothetical protein